MQDLQKMNYTLAETALKTDYYGVGLKIVPSGAKEVLVQFGYYGPASQIASATDLRELAGIFQEVADLLEGDNEAQENAAKPKEGKHAVRVKVSLNENAPTLRGVFSELTDKQVKELRHAILVMDTALPKGMHLWVQD